MSETVTPLFEHEALQEACADLCRVHALLERRVGPLYLRLKLDIERQSHDIYVAEPEVIDLGEGHFIYGPPPALSALLRRARRLRLIR